MGYRAVFLDIGSCGEVPSIIIITATPSISLLRKSKSRTHSLRNNNSVHASSSRMDIDLNEWYCS
jgi:hypothetical protein